MARLWLYSAVAISLPIPAVMRSSVASDDWRPASISPIDAQLSPDRLVGSEAQLVVHGSSVWVVVGS